MNDTTLAAPNLWRHLGCIVYETLTIAALLLLASAIATTLFGPATPGLARWLHQGLDISLVALYFLWCWVHGGQTLAMKTWSIRLVDKFGRPLSPPIAGLRFVLACAGALLGGVGFWWALFDPHHRYLHDRLAQTRLIAAPRNTRPQG